LLDAGASLDSVDQRAETFLTYYAREPVAREMRHAWLTSLADRGRWDIVLKHYRDEAADDGAALPSFDGRIALERTATLRRTSRNSGSRRRACRNANRLSRGCAARTD